MLLTLTPLMMALGGAARADPRALAESIARQAVLHPIVIATILGFAATATGLQVPGPIDGLLTLLHDAAAPCALFTLGVALAKWPVGSVPPEVPVVIGVKLIVHPLIVYLLLSWVGGFPPMWVYTAVLLAALPPATDVFVQASRYSAYVERAPAAIVLATVVSIATVTVVLILLVNDILPIDPFR
jgi:predicted permease